MFKGSLEKIAFIWILFVFCLITWQRIVHCGTVERSYTSTGAKMDLEIVRMNQATKCYCWFKLPKAPLVNISIRLGYPKQTCVLFASNVREQGERALTYDNIETDNTSVIVGNLIPRISFSVYERKSAANDRLRRNVFGKDNRIFIPSRTLAQVFPFSTVVRIGRGCTGTLIWKRHILTSAHCIHDGKKYRPPLYQQKVGLLLPDSTFKWIRVKRAFFPSAWTRKRGLKQLSHDYAVLEIEKPHLRTAMWFGTYDLRGNRYVQFTGYPSDKPRNEMWFSYCSVAKHTKNLIWNHCDAMPGMSGSGVYVYEKQSFSGRRNRKVIAIFSSYVRLSTVNGQLQEAFNVATRLTSKKIRKICRWIGLDFGCENKLLEKMERSKTVLQVK